MADPYFSTALPGPWLSSISASPIAKFILFANEATSLDFFSSVAPLTVFSRRKRIKEMVGWRERLLLEGNVRDIR